MKKTERVDEGRIEQMIVAIELDVDGDEFDFRSEQERQVWFELQAEFEDRSAREGRRWIAVGAA